MKLLADGKQASGGDRRRCRYALIADDSIGAECERQYTGDRSGRRESALSPVLLAAEYRDNQGVSGNAYREDNAAGRQARRLRNCTTYTAKQTRDRERPNARGTAARLGRARAPAAFKSDQ